MPVPLELRVEWDQLVERVLQTEAKVREDGEIMTRVRAELGVSFKTVDDKYKDLYGKADVRLGELAAELISLKEFMKNLQPSKKTGKDSLVPAKMMIPDKYDGQPEGWLRFEADVEGYVQVADEDVYLALKDLKDAKEVISEVVFAQKTNKCPFDKGQELWMLLRTKTAGDANRIVLSGPEGNGWEALRRLKLHYTPGLAINKGQAAVEFSELCRKPAKDVNDLRKKLLDFDEKVKAFKKVCGDEPEEWHAKSILAAILDPVTRQHTVTYQVEDYKDFRMRVNEFVNVVQAGSGSGVTKMDVGAVAEREGSEGGEPQQGTRALAPALGAR